MRTIIQVPSAPAGAARLKKSKCTLAALFPSPCFSSTDVSPNAAGALCTIIARKMTNESPLVVEEYEEAPSAIPSAAAWMHRPNVVDKDRDGVETRSVGEDEVERSERE